MLSIDPLAQAPQEQQLFLLGGPDTLAEPELDLAGMLYGTSDTSRSLLMDDESSCFLPECFYLEHGACASSP